MCLCAAWCGQVQGQFGNKDEPPVVTVSAYFTAGAKADTAQLNVTAKIAQGWHIYSLTTPPGGPKASTVKLDKSDVFALAGEIKPDNDPKRKQEDAFKSVPYVEYHTTQVVWSVPLKLAAGTDLKTLKVTGSVGYQACDKDSCQIPTTAKFTAALQASPKASGGASTGNADGGSENVAAYEDAAGRYQANTPSANTVLFGYVEPRQAAPGETVKVVLQAEPNVEQHFHVYELWNQPRPKGEDGSKPSLIVFTEKPTWLASGPTPDRAAETPPAEEVKVGAIPYYSQLVTWTTSFQVPADAQPGTYTLAGLMGYHSCTPVNEGGQCDRPAGVTFAGKITVGEHLDGQLPMQFERSSYSSVEKALANVASPAVPNAIAQGSDTQTPSVPAGAGGISGGVQAASSASETAWFLFYAFVGGMILNLMPCVLPVIGLKVLGFVQQAGESRGRILALNFSYSLGLLSVFWVLAVLSITLGLFWGQQFSDMRFTITLSAVVFMFALSFLGVWEVPIPGFVGSSAQMQQAAAKEGLSGAFVKGILTTVLATPCSGPFFGPAMTWAAGQSPSLAFTAFTVAGLGMASPYLLIGLAPKLVSFLPKPGAWMDTFKQAMAFVLFGTVVFLLSSVPWAYVVPTVGFLMGLWACCWWAGRVPAYANASTKYSAWVVGGAFATAVGFLCFGWLAGVMQHRYEAEVALAVTRSFESQAGTSGSANDMLWQHFLTEREEKLKTVSKEELPWQPYSPKRLELLRSRGYTVMIDFTASWCATCQTNTRFVLDQPDTRQLIDKNNVIPLLVDFSRDNPEGEALLKSLGSNSIPFLAILSAERDKPILLPDLLTKSVLSSALEEAGPSRSQVATTAQLSETK